MSFKLESFKFKVSSYSNVKPDNMKP